MNNFYSLQTSNLGKSAPSLKKWFPILVLFSCLALGCRLVDTSSFVAGFWGGTLTQPDQYTLTTFAICDDSQAEAYLAQLEADGAYLTLVGDTTVIDEDRLVMRATMVQNGMTNRYWSAIFSFDDGGIFGKCIERIDEN